MIYADRYSNDYSWDAEYVGNGKWQVSGPLVGSQWQLFEASHAVLPIHDDDDIVLRRLGC